MKKLIPLLLLSILLFPALLRAQSWESINTNGSFEKSPVTNQADTASIPGWLFLVDDGAANFAIVADQFQDSSRSLRIQITEQGSNPWSIQVVNESFSLKTGVEYKFSVWAKSDGDGTASFTVGNSSFNEFGRLDASSVSLSTEWQHFEFPFQIGAIDEQGRAPIHVNYTANVGTQLWIDNLRILQPVTEEEPVDNAINPNGSFEQAIVTTQADTASIPGWSFEVQDVGTANFAITDSVVKDGNRALAIEVLSAGNNEWSIQAINESFAVVSGVEYTFSAWAKSSSSNGTANFTVGNPMFNEFDRLGNEQVSLTTNWQLFSFTFFAPSGDSIGRAPIHLSFSANEQSTIYLDSIRISEPEIVDPIYEPIATGKPKFLGNVYSPAQFPRFTEFWNQVTPENAGKWGSVEAQRDVMNWTQLDAAYNLAKEHNFPFRMHVLVWGDQQPLWLKSLSEQEQLEELQEWFDAVAERYPNIEWLEVVNEPLHDPPVNDPNDDDSGGYIEALGGSGESGWDWILTAFRMARQTFPDSTKLMINDYNILNSLNAVESYIEIVELLNAEQLIDVIGVQGHAFTTNNNSALVRIALDQLAETDLPIMVTELDIDGDPRRAQSASDQIQLDGYKELFPIFWEHDSVVGVTLWGWRFGHWRSDQEAHLITQAEVEKPALVWLRAYVDTASVNVSVSLETPKELPARISLFQNYPNPFNPTTTIQYGLHSGAPVEIAVFDVTGRRVALFDEGFKSAGTHQLTFNASSLSSGVYFYQLRAGSIVQSKKMLLLK